MDAIAQRYDSAGYGATIQLGVAGTYVGAYLRNFSGIVTLRGDPGLPASYVIQEIPGSFVILDNSISMQVTGVTLDSTYSGAQPPATYVGRTGSLVQFFGGMRFRRATNNSLHAHVDVRSGGSVEFYGAISVVGGGAVTTIGSFLVAQSLGVSFGSFAPAGGAVITVTNLDLAIGFCRAIAGGVANWSAITFAGSATGKRFDAALNGVINVNGAGVNFLPGSVAGTTGSGGQYA
jgi:hypothetical protein